LTSLESWRQLGITPASARGTTACILSCRRSARARRLSPGAQREHRSPSPVFAQQVGALLQKPSRSGHHRAAGGTLAPRSGAASAWPWNVARRGSGIGALVSGQLYLLGPDGRPCWATAVRRWGKTSGSGRARASRRLAESQELGRGPSERASRRVYRTSTSLRHKKTPLRLDHGPGQAARWRGAQLAAWSASRRRRNSAPDREQRSGNRARGRFWRT